VLDGTGLARVVRVEARRPSQAGTTSELAKMLYDPRRCEPLVTRRVESGDDTQCLKSLYHVSKDATILVDFDAVEALALPDGVRVRARLLGDNPVELPVENYSRISKDELDVRAPRGLSGDGAATAKALLALPPKLAAFETALHDVSFAATGAMRAADEAAPGAAETRDFAERVDSALGALASVRDAAAQLVDSVASTRANLAAVAEAHIKLDRAIAAVAAPVGRVGLLTSHAACADDVTSPGCQAQVVAFSGPLTNSDEQLDTMRQALEELRSAAARALHEAADGVKPARIYLGAATTEHGDILEVIVESLEQAAAADQEAPVSETLRFRIRLVDNGVSARVAPNFTLVKRIKDVAVASERAKPSNFEITAGAALTFRWRDEAPWTDWLVPSVGIHATLPDFDPSNSFELGVGLSLGWLNDMIHAGIGWNLSVTDDREYFFISLDFLAGVDGFSQLTSKGGEE